MLGMVDEDDLSFLKEAISNRSYTLLKKVRYNSGKPEHDKRKGKKRKVVEDETLEQDYENMDVDVVKLKNLLPIKTHSGIVRQSIIDDSVDSEEQEAYNEQVESEGGELSEEETFDFPQDEFDPSIPITTAEMLATRAEALRTTKIHIGTLSSGLLENPEEKITNFKTLLNIMEEDTTEIYFTVRKLAVVSLLEVFKDLLPSYQIKEHDSGETKCKYLYFIILMFFARPSYFVYLPN